MIWQQLRGRSPAEYTGMTAIGLVVVAAWVYSISLEYSFFAAVTPGSNPMFPYLALAFTGIGLALWGIGFACAHKAFTQVMTMIMMLASGGTAVYIAWVQFQAQGDAHYNLAADPTNYSKALTIVGVMILLNVAMLVLKVIVWRFSQVGTGFFERPQLYAPVQEQQPRYVEAQPQPKEERSLEQRATRQLPPARPQGPGFWQSLVSKFNKEQEQEQEFETEDERDEWLAEIELKRERDIAEAQQRKADARSRVLARQSQPPAEAPVQQPEPVDRRPDETSTHAEARQHYRELKAEEDKKAQSERVAKQRIQPSKNP